MSDTSAYSSVSGTTEEETHIIHLHSGTKDKKPTAEQLALGEMAINHSAGSEALYIKNNDGEIIEISANASSESIVDSAMSDTSENPVANKVIKAYIDGIVGNVATQLSNI